MPNPDNESSKQIIKVVKNLNELSALNQDVTELENKLNKLVNESFGF